VIRYILVFLGGAATAAWLFLRSTVGRELIKDLAFHKTKELLYDEPRPSDYIVAEVNTHDETLQVLSAMEDFLDHYGVFTLKDIKDALGMTTTFEDSKFGWTTTEGVIRFVKNYKSAGWYVRIKKAPQPLI
jgi:hypothetical protein